MHAMETQTAARVVVKSSDVIFIFATQVLQRPDCIVRLQLRDIAGQEKAGTMTRVYFRSLHPLLLDFLGLPKSISVLVRACSRFRLEPCFQTPQSFASPEFCVLTIIAIPQRRNRCHRCL